MVLPISFSLLKKFIGSLIPISNPHEPIINTVAFGPVKFKILNFSLSLENNAILGVLNL
jgi:hypothetical protein